jgi:hypothetical protein
MPSGYTFDLIRDHGRFQLLAGEWDDLHARAAVANPCLPFGWMSACWEMVRDRTELFVVTARLGSRLVAAAPLRLERRIGLRRLSFLGGGVSPFPAFLCDPGEPGLEEALLEGLAEYRTEWDLLRLDPLMEPFTTLHFVGEVARLRLRFQPSAPSVCPSPVPAYVRGCREKLANAGCVTERYCGPQAAAQVDEVLWIETRSPGGRAPEAADRRGRISTLYREAFHRLTGGELELWLARIEGRAIAYRTALLTPDAVCLQGGGCDEGYEDLAPVSVLDLEILAAARDEGRGESLRGQPSMCMTAAPNTLRGRLALSEPFHPRPRLRTDRDLAREQRAAGGQV